MIDVDGRHTVSPLYIGYVFIRSDPNHFHRNNRKFIGKPTGW